MSNNNLFSIKMRASMENDGETKHVSGAEKIIPEKHLNQCINSLVERGLHHDKGEADFLNIKIEKVTEEIEYLDALPVTTIEVESVNEGIEEIDKFLKEINAPGYNEIKQFLYESYGMRGAMLLDIKNLVRVEPNPDRGIRATYMDKERKENECFSNSKNHYEEAIVLATKVSNCPGIVGEICISDDPNYVTGYVASKGCGYRRITKLKESGNENGGRIFLFDPDKAGITQVIEYLEKQKVIVRNVCKIKLDKVRENPLNILTKENENLKKKNLFRTMKTIETAQGRHITLAGKEYVLMASNSYLDLTNHPYIVEKTCEAIKKYGVGSGGSRLTTGNTLMHDELEKKIAQFKEAESAIAFNTGYVANLATISALMRNGGIIFSDELNHASIIDGCRLSKAKTIVYRHNDMEDLEKKIIDNTCDFGLVVSDAVFSMDGDILNLPEMVRICKKYNLLSMVDEAHATGVIGNTGHGIVEHYNMKEKPDILMGTFSKSIGGEGGYVAGNKVLIEYLRNYARGFIFSTSLSPAIMAANIAGIEIIEAEPERIKRLQSNVEYFCECLKNEGMDIYSQTAIIPIIIGDEKKAMDVSAKLFDAGYYISAIRYPTVAKGEARLRVAIMATHTKEELQKVAKLITEYTFK